MPFLKLISSSVSQVDSALQQTLATVGDKHVLVTSDQPVSIFLDTAAARTVVRRLMIEARCALIVAAIDSVQPSPAPNATSNLARMILLMLGLSKGFCQQHCLPLELGTKNHKNKDFSVVSAVLMSFAAQRHWTPAVFDSILSGDIGDRQTAKAAVQKCMDEALCHVVSLFPSYLQERLKERFVQKLSRLSSTASGLWQS